MTTPGCFAAFLLAIVLSSQATLLSAADLPLSVTLSRPDDAVSSTSKDGRVVLNITSKTGIGKATLTPGDKKWPEKLELRLKLKGLEGFTIRQGDLALHRSGDAFRGPDGDAARVKVDKAFFPTITQDGEFFHIVVPAVWLKAGEPSLTVEWIDFYRR